MISALPDIAAPGPVAPAPILPPQGGGAVDFAGLLNALPDAAPTGRLPAAMPPLGPTLTAAAMPGGTLLPAAAADLPPATSIHPAGSLEAAPATDAAPPAPFTEPEPDEAASRDPAPQPFAEDEEADLPAPAPSGPPPVMALLTALPVTPAPIPASAPRTPVVARAPAAPTTPAPLASVTAPILPLVSPDDPAASVETSATSALLAEPPAGSDKGASPAPAPAPAASPAMPAPNAAPAPASSPAISPEPRTAPQQESAIAQVGEIREALRAARPEMTLRHAEFGFVNLRVEAAGTPDGWRAVLASRDPGFVAAVQTALAERAVAASSDSAATNTGTHQGGASDQRYGSSHSSGQGSSSPYLEQFPKRDEGGERHRQRQPGPQGDERRGDDGEQTPARTRRGMFA